VTADDGWVVDSIDAAEAGPFPPAGIHTLRLTALKKCRFRWPSYQWSWSFDEPSIERTFATLTTQSMKHSNALGLLTALNGGRPPTTPFDPRAFVGSTLVAQTSAKPNGFPGLLAVKPTDPDATFKYRLQSKGAAPSTL
jgi:hypothetical protein